MKVQPFSPPLSLNPYPFQRSTTRLKLRKVNKKIRLTFKHITLLFALAGFLTYLGSRAYVSLTTWEKLRVRQIKINTNRLQLRQELMMTFGEKNLGNILKLDLKTLEKNVLSHPWVKSARLRKILPSTLEISIEERQPLILVKTPAETLLVDEEGVILEKESLEAQPALPWVFIPTGAARLTPDDLALVKECLQAIPPEGQPKARLFLVRSPACLILEFVDQPTRLILGRDHFEEKLALYRQRRAWLEESFGPLEYVDLRFYEDRIYFQPKSVLAGDLEPASLTKEEF